MLEVSDDFIADVWCEEPPPQAVLVTLVADGMADPIRVTNFPGELAGDRVNQGIVSNGETYLYAPFEFGFGGAGQGEPARDASLTVYGYDGEVEEAVRLATGRPALTVVVVRESAPDIAEIAMTGASLQSVEMDGPKITATIRPRDFASEPACAARATPARVPCLF